MNSDELLKQIIGRLNNINFKPNSKTKFRDILNEKCNKKHFSYQVYTIGKSDTIIT